MSNEDKLPSLDELLKHYNPEVLKFIIDHSKPDWKLDVVVHEDGDKIALVAKKRPLRGKR